MQRQRVKVIASLALITACLVFLGIRFINLKPSLDDRPHIGIGTVLAERAIKLLGAGGRLAIIVPDTTLFEYPGAEAQLKAFQSVLRRAKVQVSSTHRVRLDPLRPPRTPAGDLVEILRKYNSESDVVVSLLGPGVPTPDLKPRIPARHARIVALCSGEMPKQINLASLFDENLLHMAIVNRPNPDFIRPASDEPMMWFDHFYQVITSKSAAEKLDPSRTSPP
jgi:hypothetical protein